MGSFGLIGSKWLLGRPLALGWSPGELVLLSKLPRGSAGFLSEEGDEAFDVVETGTVGDAFEVEVCSEDQVFGVVESSADDLVVQRASEGVAEASFEGSARDGDLIENVFDADGLACSGLDVSENGPQDRVVCGEGIGTSALHHGGRLDNLMQPVRWMSLEHAMDGPGGEETDDPCVGIDAAEGGVGVLAEEFVVVDADDGGLIGDLQAPLEQGEFVGLGVVVAVKEDADGPALGSDPIADGFLEAVGFGEDLDMPACPAHGVDEALATLF